MKCWGLNYYGQTNIPILKNPTFISSGQHSACAIDDEGVKCWGRNDEGQTDVPFLKHPISVSAGGYHTCAIDDEGVKCWGQNSNGQTDVPHLQNPTFVSAGSWHTCAIDDEGVKCWGAGDKTKFPIPTFKNPTSVSAGSSRSCAIDEEGVKCWGIFYYGQANIPSLFFFEDNRLEIFIYQLAYWSTSVRTSFFSSLKTFMNNNLKTTEVLPVPDQLVHGRYIFTAFLKTSIETGDSVVNIENIIPAYIAKIKKITEKTGIQNLDHVKDYPLTRLTALKIMQASLSTMTEFLKAEDKAHIQDVIKLIGTAMTDVSSKQLINNALAAIDTNEPIINKLTQSPKTQFFVLTLKTAQQWLNTKIK